MPDQTIEAAPSAVQEAPAVESFAIPRSNTPEYAEWRKSGSLPAKKPDAPKPAESASAPDPSVGDKPESGPESEPEHTQQEQPAAQPKKLDAKGRAAQLDKTIEAELEKETPDFDKIATWEKTRDRVLDRAGLKRKTATAPVTPQQAQAQPQAPQQQYTRPKPTAEDKNPDGTPKYGSYEDYVEELADWKAEQRIVRAQQEYATAAQQRELLAKVEQGKAIYGEEFATIADSTAGVIGQDPNIPMLIKQRFSRSDVLPHLTYIIGNEEGGAEKFAHLAKTDPFKALDYIALTESLIRENLSKGNAETTARNGKGQFARQEPDHAPVKRGPESAPEPPIEIGSRGGGSVDETARALSAAERGDAKAFAAWKRAEDAKDIRRRKGI